MPEACEKVIGCVNSNTPRAEAKVKVREVVSVVREDVSEVRENARQALASLKKPALLAMMTSPDKDVYEALGNCQLNIGLVARGMVRFHGDLRSLLVVTLIGDPTKPARPVSEQLCQLIPEATQNFLPSQERLDGPCIWPLHGPYCSEGIMLQAASIDRNIPWWRKMLIYMGANIAQHNHAAIAVREQFGKLPSYIISSSRYLVMMLWGLLCVSVPFLFMHEWLPFGSQRQVIIQCIVVLIWGCISYALPEFIQTIPADDMYKYDFTQKVSRESTFHHLRFVLLGIPGIVAFFLLILLINLIFVQLLALIIYDWGDCANRGCRDPSHKHGYLGVLVEIGCDVGFAIMWEIIYALSNVFVSWLSNLRHFEDAINRQYFETMVGTMLNGTDKVMVFMVLGVMFVPQFYPPVDLPDGVFSDTSRDCSDLWTYELFGNSAIQCLGRRLPVEFRRNIFGRALKGPFCVAPFIGILVKTIVPFAARELYKATRCCLRNSVCRIVFAVPLFIFRFVVLIFAYDGDSVGCCIFLWRDWPFTDFQVLSVDSLKPQQATDDMHFGQRHGAANLYEGSTEEDLLKSSLDQIVLKQYEPYDEIIDIKLTWLWMLFFVPIGPFGSLGVVTTLAANWIKLRSDFFKLLFGKRRSFYPWNGLIRKEEREFLRAVVLSCVGWYLVLILVIFNDHLHHWPWAEYSYGFVELGFLVVWIGLSFFSTFGRLQTRELRLSKACSTDSVSSGKDIFIKPKEEPSHRVDDDCPPPEEPRPGSPPATMMVENFTI